MEARLDRSGGDTAGHLDRCASSQFVAVGCGESRACRSAVESEHLGNDGRRGSTAAAHGRFNRRSLDERLEGPLSRWCGQEPFRPGRCGSQPPVPLRRTGTTDRWSEPAGFSCVSRRHLIVVSDLGGVAGDASIAPYMVSRPGTGHLYPVSRPTDVSGETVLQFGSDSPIDWPGRPRPSGQPRPSCPSVDRVMTADGQVGATTEGPHFLRGGEIVFSQSCARSEMLR